MLQEADIISFFVFIFSLLLCVHMKNAFVEKSVNLLVRKNVTILSCTIVQVFSNRIYLSREHFQAKLSAIVFSLFIKYHIQNAIYILEIFCFLNSLMLNTLFFNPNLSLCAIAFVCLCRIFFARCDTQ